MLILYVDRNLDFNKATFPSTACVKMDFVFCVHLTCVRGHPLQDKDVNERLT